jgi:hypothetical protein
MTFEEFKIALWAISPLLYFLGVCFLGFFLERFNGDDE